MPYFGDDEGEWLVRTARRVLEEFFRRGEVVYFEPPTPRLREPAGVFTTLKTYPAGSLRGCIGYPEPVKPLYRALSEVSVLAATDDPRFPPLSAGELDSVTVEVSALTPPVRLDVPKEEIVDRIVIGRDGLILRYGPYSGLLLPQVAVEEGWDAEEFLRHVSLKAGLPPDAWTWPDTDIYTFQAEVFAEREPKGRVVRVM
ncbi:TPA: TIGR00296 family protein [Candidatus Micrarchaeota archaeon]|nr:TIGR00296 family protein [Candidatus Micrarchaeota archaeon]